MDERGAFINEKLVLILFLTLLALPVFSKSYPKTTLTCSYITADTDFYVKLNPMVLFNNGEIKNYKGVNVGYIVI